MNLQTAVSARLDPVLGVNPPGSIPSSSAAGSSDTFARLLERRVHESQGTSSSAPAAAPAPAETAQTAPAEASGTAKSPQSSQDDDPAPTPPAKAETAKEKASPSATSDKSDSKKEKSAEEPGTAAEVAAPADAAAAALAAAAMPTAASAGHSEALPSADGDGKTLSAARAPVVSTLAATNGSAQQQTSSTATDAAAFPPSSGAAPDANLALPSTSSPTPPNDDAAAAPTASDSNAVPGSPLALLRAALEKLSNAPKEGAQTPEVGQSGEAASAESPAEAGATLKNSPSGKHDPSLFLDAAASAAPSEKSPADALKPEKTLTSETPSSVRAEHADSTQTPSPTVRSDGFTPNPHLSSRADASAPTVLTVHTPPADTDRWASETTQRLVWVAGRGETKAELQLTPPSLGKLEVTLQLNHDQLTAHFVAASQAARDALEHALPQLREQLAQSGLSLGQTSVSTGGEGSNAQSQEDPASGRPLPGTTPRAGANPAPLSLQGTRGGSSLIDHYA